MPAPGYNAASPRVRMSGGVLDIPQTCTGVQAQGRAVMMLPALDEGGVFYAANDDGPRSLSVGMSPLSA